MAGDYGDLDPVGLRRITAALPVRPDTPYGVGKALGEAAARYFSEEHRMSMLCLRIGSLTRADRPSTNRHFATLITHADMTRLARCCIEAPDDLSFGIYYGVSRNTWRIWDIGEASRELGYEPRDNVEQWRNSVAASPADNSLKRPRWKLSRARNANVG
jgi:uronate dehydrogenase